MSKRFLFAGASSTIACACCKILTEQGHEVIGLSTKAAMTGYTEWYSVNSYNISDFPDISNSLDGVVYFPGTINLKPFNRLTKNDFETDWTINTMGAVYFVQKYLSQLKQSGAGSVVFISSVAAQTGMPFHASVSMAKGALESLVPSLAAELAPSIRVNAVAPSLTQTTLSDRLINTPEKIAAAGQRNPMKKVGTAEEVAEAICFLLSEKSSWITGQVISVDGGMRNLKS
jgi:3-oxoacyl-[acyl-carrier protein] reductase